MQIVWNDNYSVGITELDEQHQLLIELANELDIIQSSIKTISYEKEIDQILNEIKKHVLINFTTEEVLMRMFEYDFFETHKFSHDKFLHIMTEHHKYIMELMAKQKQIKDNKFDSEELEREINARVSKVTTFIQKSLINHFVKEDKEYSAFFIDIQNKAQKSSGWLSSLVGSK